VRNFGGEGHRWEGLIFNVPTARNVIRVLSCRELFPARSDNHSSPQTIPKRGNTMIKTGDLFKSMESGKVFAVKGAFPSVIILETKDKSHSMFVNPNNMESKFLPYVEDDGKKNSKKD
jgi:hypothetical protein